MPRMENASNVNHAFDPQAYIRKQQSIELANHIAPERSSNGKVVRRSLIDSQPANQDGVVAPASFDVTARVPNPVRRVLPIQLWELPRKPQLRRILPQWSCPLKERGGSS